MELRINLDNLYESNSYLSLYKNKTIDIKVITYTNIIIYFEKKIVQILNQPKERTYFLIKKAIMKIRYNWFIYLLILIIFNISLNMKIKSRI